MHPLCRYIWVVTYMKVIMLLPVLPSATQCMIWLVQLQFLWWLCTECYDHHTLGIKWYYLLEFCSVFFSRGFVRYRTKLVVYTRHSSVLHLLYPAGKWSILEHGIEVEWIRPRPLTLIFQAWGGQWVVEVWLHSLIMNYHIMYQLLPNFSQWHIIRVLTLFGANVLENWVIHGYH